MNSTIHPASVRTIAKKDFLDAVRSWVFWLLSAFFFALLAIGAIAFWYLAQEGVVPEASTELLLTNVTQVTRLVIPVIALLLGWKAIAGEREAGSMKVLLSLPHSRSDVVLGKLLGRSAVLSLSLGVGFALAAVVVATLMGGFAVGDYLGVLAMSIVYGVAYVSIAVAISTLTKSTSVAATGIFGVFVLFYLVWNVLFSIISMLVELDYIAGVTWDTVDINGAYPLERPPDWAYLIDLIDPGTAYSTTLSLVTRSVEIGFGPGDQEQLFPDGVPFYLQDWFGLIVLIAWILVPLAIAFYRFDRVDL